MDISYSCSPGGLNTHVGYGNAGLQMVNALNKLGHRVLFQDDSPKVEISFCQPDDGPWSNEDAYHIQYTPWESTVLPDGWVNSFNTNCDEVWTTSEWCKEVFIANGVKTPVKVVPHGIDHDYTPLKRHRDKTLKFLSIGAPEPRKNVQMTVDAFWNAFGDRTDVSLTVKAHERLGRVSGHEGMNVNVIRDDYSRPEMIELVRNHDVLVYPTSGEGFGFIPLEGMATGMPVITTTGWADYKDLVPADLHVLTTVEPSPWPKYPGHVFMPSLQDLTYAMEIVEKDFGTYSQEAFSRAPEVHRRYDWEDIMGEAIKPIVARFDS